MSGSNSLAFGLGVVTCLSLPVLQECPVRDTDVDPPAPPVRPSSPLRSLRPKHSGTGRNRPHSTPQECEPNEAWGRLCSHRGAAHYLYRRPIKKREWSGPAARGRCPLQCDRPRLDLLETGQTVLFKVHMGGGGTETGKVRKMSGRLRQCLAMGVDTMKGLWGQESRH